MEAVRISFSKVRGRLIRNKSLAKALLPPHELDYEIGNYLGPEVGYSRRGEPRSRTLISWTMNPVLYQLS